MATTTLKQVATQSRRKVSTVVHLTRDASLKLIDAQRAIWLAGPGALAKVTTSSGTEGEQALDARVKQALARLGYPKSSNPAR